MDYSFSEHGRLNHISSSFRDTLFQGRPRPGRQESHGSQSVLFGPRSADCANFEESRTSFHVAVEES